MEVPASIARKLILLSLLCLGAVAHGQSNSVSIGLTSFIIQSENNRFSTASFPIAAAPAYTFAITGNVHGEGPLFSQLVPASESAAQAFESIHKGLSAVLQGSVSDSGSARGVTVLNEAVSTGTDNLLNATFSISIDDAGLVSFAITNVAIVTNGQPDTTDRLVFDTGSVELTALYADVTTVTLMASNITPGSASLTASVICANAFETWFTYGSETALTGTTAMVSLSGSNIAQGVTIPVTGLLPHHLYYFRAVAADVTGPANGSVQTFFTADSPPVAGAVTAYAGTLPYTIPVLAHCSDPDGDKLKVMSVSSGGSGTAMVAHGGGAVSYAFTSGSALTGQFAYTINDGFGLSATGQVTMINYAALAGSYAGLLKDPLLTNPVLGLLKAQLAPTGACTGVMNVTGTSYRFAGALDDSGRAVIAVNLSKHNAIHFLIQMNEEGGAYVLNAEVSDGLQQQTAVLARQGRAFSGSYNALLPFPDGAAYAGTGYARVMISVSGLAGMAGVLPDGAAFSCSSVIDSTGLIPVFSSLYGAGNGGGLAGSLGIMRLAPGLVSGTVAWSKPAEASVGVDPGPFFTLVGVSGEKYVAPVNGPALEFGTYGNIGQIEIAGPNVNPPIKHGLMLSGSNGVTVLGPPDQNLVVVVHPASGLFTGEFTDPVDGFVRQIRGVLLPSEVYGAGFYTGGYASGEIGISR